MGCTKVFQLYEFLFLGRFIIGVNCGKCSISTCMLSSPSQTAQ
jgi:hypothetical protein